MGNAPGAMVATHRHWSNAMMRTALLALSLAVSIAALAAPEPASGPSSTSSTPLPVDTVKCKDGTSALRPVKQGTCSGHGGVAPSPENPQKAPPAVVTPTPEASTAATTPPKGATAQCKDGTYSMSKTHSGACSGHGGVDKWL
jgi:serine/threonine-protein kinase